MRSFKGGIFLILLFTAAVAFAWQEGDRILGQWGDGYWYPGIISEASGDGFNVSFDDGDTAVLPASQNPLLTDRGDQGTMQLKGAVNIQNNY